jgi:hypothetical protein
MSETPDYRSESQNPHIQRAYEQAQEKLRNIADTGDEERLNPTERMHIAKEQLFGLGQNLAEGIRNNHWQIVVGEDVSGRVPALFIYELMKQYNAAHNVEPPKLFFLSSGKKIEADGQRVDHDNFEELFDYIKQHRDVAKNKRVLYITDVVHSGDTLLKSTIALGGNGIVYDVASLDSYISPSVRDKVGLRQTTFYTGPQVDEEELGNLYTGFGGKPALRQAVGVEKDGNKPITRATYQNSGSVAELRAQIKSLAKEAYTIIFAQPA